MYRPYDHSITYHQSLLEEEEYRNMKSLMGEYEIKDTAELSRLIEQGKKEASDAIRLLQEVRQELIQARKSTLKYSLGKGITQLKEAASSRLFWIHVASVGFLALSFLFIYSNSNANNSSAHQPSSRQVQSGSVTSTK